MEGADQVLALRRVDAGLAADRGIDLRQQRGRHLHEAHAAAQDAGGKAGEIADDAAAQGDDEIAALEAHLEQPLAQRAPAPGSSWSPRPAPAPPCRRAARPPRGPLSSAREVARGHVLVGDDGAPGGAEPRSRSAPPPAPAGRGRSARRRSGRRARPGRVARRRRLCGDACVALMALAQRRRRPAGRPAAELVASASMISPTMTSCGTSRLSTVRSAVGVERDSAPPSAPAGRPRDPSLEQRTVVALEHAAHQHAAARP